MFGSGPVLAQVLRRVKHRILASGRVGPAARGIIAPFSRPLPRRPFLFVIGCYNSGTSLLTHALSQHPEIGSLPTEGAALTSHLPRPEDFGWPRLYYQCLEKVYADDTTTTLDADRVKRDWGLWYDASNSLFLEKSISNSARIRWLDRHFPDSHFLVIRRNGYCVAEGIHRRTMSSKRYLKRFGRGGFPIEWPAKQWVISNAIIERDTRGLRHVYKLSYEDLTDNYSVTMQSIVEWLPTRSKDLPGLTQFTFHGKDRDIQNMNAASLARLEADDIRRINRIGERYLVRWGYELLSVESDP
jgi:Sulfotransferase family